MVFVMVETRGSSWTFSADTPPSPHSGNYPDVFQSNHQSSTFRAPSPTPTESDDLLVDAADEVHEYVREYVLDDLEKSTAIELALDEESDTLDSEDDEDWRCDNCNASYTSPVSLLDHPTESRFDKIERLHRELGDDGTGAGTFTTDDKNRAGETLVIKRNWQNMTPLEQARAVASGDMSYTNMYPAYIDLMLHDDGKSKLEVREQPQLVGLMKPSPRFVDNDEVEADDEDEDEGEEKSNKTVDWFTLSDAHRAQLVLRARWDTVDHNVPAYLRFLRVRAGHQDRFDTLTRKHLTEERRELLEKLKKYQQLNANDDDDDNKSNNSHTPHDDQDLYNMMGESSTVTPPTASSTTTQKKRARSPGSPEQSSSSPPSSLTNMRIQNDMATTTTTTTAPQFREVVWGSRSPAVKKQRTDDPTTSDQSDLASIADGQEQTSQSLVRPSLGWGARYWTCRN